MAAEKHQIIGRNTFDSFYPQRLALAIKLYEADIFCYLRSFYTYDNDQIVYHENTFIETSNSNALRLERSVFFDGV